MNDIFSFLIPQLYLFLSLFGEPQPGPQAKPVVIIGQCDPRVGERPFVWTAAKRKEVRSRVDRVFHRELRTSPLIRDYAQVILCRESYCGVASVRHTLGKNEDGLGPMGLSLPWHHDKWPGKDEDPKFCTPEVSAIVAHAIMWRAVRYYHATNIVHLQAVFAGRWHCDAPPGGKRECYAHSFYRQKGDLCNRMAAVGRDCMAPITRKDLGKYIPLAKRRAFVEDILEKAGPST